MFHFYFYLIYYSRKLLSFLSLQKQKLYILENVFFNKFEFHFSLFFYENTYLKSRRNLRKKFCIYIIIKKSNNHFGKGTCVTVAGRKINSLFSYSFFFLQKKENQLLALFTKKLHSKSLLKCEIGSEPV